MSLSLNEVQALCRKAARGAGYDWGLADEAGFAVRWLERQGLQGCATLATWLTHVEAQGVVSSACPLCQGAALADGRAVMAKVDPVAFPLLVLPFAGELARVTETVVMLRAGGGEAVTDGQALTLQGAFPDTATPLTLHVGRGVPKPRPVRSRASPEAGVLAVLDRFAHRTYAPATEASRLKGAGAGVSDND